MATGTKATKVFSGLRCLHCGEPDTLAVKLEGLTIECVSCGEEIERAEVDAMVATWTKLFGWIDSAATFADPK